jgi:hypothetical protein
MRLTSSLILVALIGALAGACGSESSPRKDAQVDAPAEAGPPDAPAEAGPADAPVPFDMAAERAADAPAAGADTAGDAPASPSDGAGDAVPDAGAADGDGDAVADTDSPPPLPWTRRGTGGVAGTDAPGHRSGHAMAYDEARGKVVLFGGRASNFYCATGVCDDTWEWDGAAGTWARKTPAGGEQPPPRAQHAMTWDPVRRRVLLHGGSDGIVFTDGGFHSTYRQDTWEWDGTTWTEVTPAGAKPSPRQSPGLAWDRERDRAVLFGGGEYDGRDPVADTWEWDGGSRTWTERTPATSPEARQGHAMAFHPVRKTVLLFGGSTGSQYLGDTWEWNGATGAWTPLAAASGPARRFSATMEWDGDRLLLYGGALDGFVMSGQTWAWDDPAGTWDRLGDTAPMPPRAYHAMAYDAGRGKLVVFAGVNNRGSTILDDLWEL